MWILRRGLIIALCMMPVEALAQAVLDTTGAKPGRYYFELIVADDGAISVKQVQMVLLVQPVPSPRPPEDPPTPPEDPPTPAPPQTTAEKVAAWTRAVNDPNLTQTAVSVSAVYRHTAQTVAGNPDATKQVLVALIDSLYGAVMRARGTGPAWEEWKSKVDALVKAAADVKAAEEISLQVAEGLDQVIKDGAVGEITEMPTE